MNLLRKYGFVLFVLFTGCIGIDYLDDEIVPEQIILAEEEVSLVVGQGTILEAIYFNEFGLEESVPLSWTSSDADIAYIENDSIHALTKGQVTVLASYMGITSDSLLVTVAETSDELSRIAIMASTTFLQVGESAQLSVRAYDGNGNEVEVPAVDWASDDESVISVNDGGLVTAHMDGMAGVKATAGGVMSLKLKFTIGGLSRSGTFEGGGSYETSGSVILAQDDSGVVTLVLSGDFMTEFALGTYVYLSNSKEGPATRSNGLELGEITANGGRTFNVTAVDAEVEVDTYQYVIILCKPASLTFGSAELN